MGNISINYLGGVFFIIIGILLILQGMKKIKQRESLSGIRAIGSGVMCLLIAKILMDK